jgi:hypothetical protein
MPWLLAILGILIIAVIVQNGSSPSSTGTATADSKIAAPAPADPHLAALQNTKLEKFSWYKDGFGSVMIANFTIRNDGDVAVKDIEIQCVHSAPSGTVIDQNTRTIYDLIPAHKTRTFRNFNMGFIDSQASRSNCQIEDLTAVQ